MNVHVSNPRPPGHDWTEAELDLLTKRRTEGKSATDIALELGHGLSRSAVLGKVHRMKLVAHKVKSKGPKKFNKPLPVLRNPRAVKVHPADVSDLPALRFEPHRPGTRLETDPADGVDVTNLLGLTADTCRFPVGDVTGEQQLFCGCRPKEGSPYCREHSARAFNAA